VPLVFLGLGRCLLYLNCVHCIEDMDNFFMGEHFYFFILCLGVVWFFFFFWVHCNEDMDNDAYHR
jgi:hypothetical protein